MNGQEYDFILDESDTTGTKEEQQKRASMKKDKMGFIAQELKEVLPEAVVYEEAEDRYYIDYIAVIPVIVEAMKEQQATIDELTTRIATLEGSAAKEKSATITTTTEETTIASEKATLDQNIPNPFSSTTRVDISLPTTVKSATLYIYNMQGSQVKSYTITNRGNTSITIDGYTLDAGMYLYSLIADGKEVDTKKMILTK